MIVIKNLDHFRKKMESGQKKLHFWPKILHFLRYTYENQTTPNQLDHKSPIYWGTSGYLRFSGGGCLAARQQAVFHHPLTKVAFFGPKTLFFGCKSIFCATPPIFSSPSWLNTRKTTFLCCSRCWASSGRLQEPILGPKIWFLCFPLYCMVLYGTAWSCWKCPNREWGKGLFHY